MKIREATLDDIEVLIKLRLDFISMIDGELPDEIRQAIKLQLGIYYRKHLSASDFIAVFAEDKQQIMAAAFMVTGERPAGASFITGLTGTILNVITYPEYRKKGYATLLVESLIQKGKELNITAIDLFATQLGKGVYQNLDFTSIKDTAMRLKL